MKRPARCVNTMRASNPHERKLTMKNTTLLRPRLLVAVGAAFALTLSGCAIDTSTPTTDAPVTDRVLASTTHAAPAEVEPHTAEDVLEATLRSEGIDTPAGFAAQYADIVCTGFDDGLDLYDMVAIGHQEIPRYSVNEHAFMVGASVGTFCPEHAAEVGR